MESNTATSTGIPPRSSSIQNFVVMCKDLQNVIGPEDKKGEKVSFEEVLEALKNYIIDRKLFDGYNPRRICCDEALKSVFGVSEFTIFDVRKLLLQKLIFPSNNYSAESISSSSVCDSSLKRKSETDDTEVTKKSCSCSFINKHPPSPMILHIPPSPLKYDSSSDTAESVQGYETAFAKDTSDDYFVFKTDDSDDFLSAGESFVAIEETYNLEYEVETDSSTDKNSGTDTDTDSEIEEALQTAIITFVSRTDSDMEFFADTSSPDDDVAFDAEISESDKWKCSRCGSLNKPPMRFCERCWDKRKGWCSEKDRERRVRPKRKKKKNQSKTDGKALLLEAEKVPTCNTETDFASTSSPLNSQDIASTSTPFSSQEIPHMPSNVDKLSNCDQDAKLCMLCVSKPINASIIHGKYAHTISCYKCARKLKRQKKTCPICRRTIDRVVYQISAF